MSEREDDQELAALQRQLDDAFETTRPRVGFEDELWTRMQARRPAGTRLRDAWLGLVQGIRAVPAVPPPAAAPLPVPFPPPPPPSLSTPPPPPTTPPPSPTPPTPTP